MQDDVLFSTLTVYETLLVAAELRLDSSIPRSRKLEIVESMISELGELATFEQMEGHVYACIGIIAYLTTNVYSLTA